MQAPAIIEKKYRFDFWKDRFWIWAACLPFGLVCWAIPFVMLVGLMLADNSSGWFPVLGFILLGIPGYLVGWIFIYSLMEGIFTTVTITPAWISVRLPWLLFPLIPVVKMINLAEVRRINLHTPYGSRRAVSLYYLKRNKERHFYLPRFEHDLAYLQALQGLKDRIEPPLQLAGPARELDAPGSLSAREPQISHKRKAGLPPILLDRMLNTLSGYSILALFAGSCWIMMTLPVDSRIDAAIKGVTLTLVCLLLIFFGLLPGLGQLALWFYGRPMIHSILGFFDVPDLAWELPPIMNELLVGWRIPPVHSTLVEFLFWTILIISIELSLGVLLGWVRRRIYSIRKHPG